MKLKNIINDSDLIGCKYGSLTIIKRVDDYITPKGQRMKKVLCECECGKFKEVIFNNLKHGTVKSCGCKTRQYMRESKRKYNTYDLTGEYGIGFTSNTNKQFYFDLEDYYKIKDYCWFEHHGYICSKINNKYISIHRIIFDLKSGNEVDHINTNNKFDNRKLNLRILTHVDNMCNKKKQINNTSGTTGVYWCNSKKKWIADITRHKKRIAKQFNNKEDAILYRKELEELLQKEYSYDNSQKYYKEVSNL